uniref:Uncharacterized protein n=1 Tax=Glossina morsitans morsitans TaxID=37546 RepID=A0ABK9NG76_GLOMM
MLNREGSTNNIPATAQPKMPAPNSKHLVVTNKFRFKSGSKRHFINFKFRFTEFSAKLKNYKIKKKMLIQLTLYGRIHALFH